MKTKRFLSILLSLVLVLGMFPGMSLTAYAEGNTTTITPSSTSGTMTITLKIKDAQTISASDVTATYGDTDKSVSASVTTPATGGGAISYAVKEGSGDYIDVDASTGALTIKKVPADGKAYVIVTAAATHDYAETTKEVTVNISTKAMTVSASDVTATADGQPHGITVNVTDPATGYTVKYGTEEGSYTLDASPTQTEVGEKTVYYQVTVDNYTTYTGSAKVTVSAKQTQTITAENVTAAYGDTGKSIEASTSGDGTLSYAVKSGDAVTVNETTGALTIVKAGSAIITVTASETATYTQATKDVTVTINKANAVAATVTANNRTYDGTAQPLVTVTGEPTGGMMQYALGTATEATQPYTTSIPAKTDAGTYYVYYKAIGDSNHTDSQEYTVEVTINKAAPDYTAPEDLTAECGTKVGDIELPEGFAWNSPDSVVMNIGDNEAVLTYTPADTDNYLIVDDIQVIVKGTGIHHAKISETCEDNGVAEYWEDGAGNKFSDENGKNALTDEQTVIEKLGHNFIHFIKWVWDGFNNAIAWLFCDNDPDHVETIDVPSKIDTVDEPTCTEDGYNYYVATIDVAGKIYTTVNVETKDQLGHKWGEPTYTWNDDNSECTAERACTRDNSHTETEKVKTTYKVITPATCEEDGLGRYTAVFENEAFKAQTKDITLEKLGHEWTNPVWNWTSDTKASVTLTCAHDKTHTKTVDAAVGVVVTEEATEEKDGVRTYTAKVTVDGVEYTTTRTETIPKIESVPNTPTPDVPTPDVPTPDVPTPDVPTPDVPRPDVPTPVVPTPDKPTPVVPTPDEPTPDKPTPDEPTPDKPTPDEPTPDVPTPDEPTPDKPTPDEPTPDKPTPDEPTPDKPTPDEPTPDKPTPDEPTPAKEIKGILGDVNNDGQVDSADALLILRNSVGLEVFDDTQRFLGDVNEDNENIDSSDALAVLRYSVGLIDIEKIGTPVSKTVA